MLVPFPTLILCILDCYCSFHILSPSISAVLSAILFLGLTLSGVCYFGINPPIIIKAAKHITTSNNIAISIDRLSIENVSVDIFWTWIYGKIRGSMIQNPPVLFRVRGLHLVIGVREIDSSTKTIPEKQPEKTNIDDLMRSMHRKISSSRPLTTILAFFGFDLNKVKVELHDELHSSISELVLNIQVRVGRVDPAGDEIFLDTKISAGGCSMSGHNRANSICRCKVGAIGFSEAICLKALLPYPIDVRSVAHNRPILLPSNLDLTFPNIVVVMKEVSVFSDLPNFLINSNEPKVPPPPPPPPLKVLGLMRYISISVSLAGVTLDSSFGTIQVLNLSLEHKAADDVLVKDDGQILKRSVSCSLETIKATLPKTNILSPEQVAHLSGLTLVVVIGADPSTLSKVSLCLSVHLAEISAVLSRDALIAVSNLLALLPNQNQQTSQGKVLNDKPTGFTTADQVWLDASIEARVSSVAVNIPMHRFLNEAGDARVVDLALDFQTANIKAHLNSKSNDTSFDGSLELMRFFEKGIDGGECIVVGGILMSNEVSETVVNLDVDSFVGRWSPLMTKCCGAIAGGVAREFFDLIFDTMEPTPLSPLTEAVQDRVQNPLTQEGIDQLLRLDCDNILHSQLDVAVIITCKIIEMDFPFKLWKSASSDPPVIDGAMTTRCGAFLQSMERIYGVWSDKADEDWESIAVRVDRGTVVVKTPPNELPIIQMLLRSTELSMSGLDEWTQLSGGAKGSCLKCEAFGLESFGDRVIELCISEASTRWSPRAMLRVLKAARDVTYSVWESLLCYRVLKYKDRNPTLHINADLEDSSELLDCARRFKKLLGATGDKLHRLYADSIHLEIASAAPLKDSTCFAEVNVGKLSSLDLPEVWSIEDVSVALTGHPTLSLQSLSFQRTLDRCPSLIVGAALNELRTRYHCVVSKRKESEQEQHEKLAIKSAYDAMTEIIPIERTIGGASTVGKGREGFLISLVGVVVRVGTKFRIADTVADEALHLQALVSAVMSLPGRWIPGCDDFKRLFRSSTTYEHILFGDLKGPQPAPEMWIKLKNLDLSLADDPMEAWLERAYPMWLDEMEHRMLREEQLRKRVVAVKVTNSAEGAFALSSALQEDFLLSNSRFYISRVKDEKLSLEDLQEETSEQRADKLCVSISSCEMHALVPKLADEAGDEEGSGGKQRGHNLIRSLDACPPPLNASFDVFAFTCFEVSACNLSVTVRRFKTPIFAAQALKLNGSMLLTTTTAPFPNCHRVSHVTVDAGLKPQQVVQTFELPRVYLDLVGHVSHPSASYSPAYEFGLEEIAASCGALYPDSMTLDPSEKAHALRWWDAGRRILTTRLDITAGDMNLSLLPSLRTFSNRFEATPLNTLSSPALSIFANQKDFSATIRDHILSGSHEELRIVCAAISMKFEKMRISTDVRGMSCEQYPSPKNTLPLASLPCAALTMTYEWDCEGDPSNYHFYPIVCDDGEVVDLTAKRVDVHLDNGDTFWGFRSQGLRLCLSAKLLPCPEPLKLHFDGDSSSLFSAPTSFTPPRTTSSLDHPVIVVYASSLGWLVNWANAFKRIPNVPYPAKCRPAVDSGIWGLKAHIRGIRLDDSGIEGMAKLAFLDQPSTPTQESQGVMICAHGSSVSMKVSEETTFPNPFLTGKLSTDPDDPSRLWVVHGVSVAVGLMEGFVIQDMASFNKQGIFLFSAASLGFDQSVVSSAGVTLRHSLESSTKRPDRSNSPNQPKINSIELANENIPSSSSVGGGSLYGLADSYLNAVFVNDVKVAITVVARDCLMEFGERVVQILTETLPDGDKPRDDLLHGTVIASDPTKEEVPESFLSLEEFGLENSKINELEPEKVSPAPTPESSLDTMGGLFIVSINSVQIQALDVESKSAVLIALPSLIIQGWIGQLADPSPMTPPEVTTRQTRSESSLSRGVVEETLQRLVRHELPRFVEATHIQIRGAALLEAPTDLDGNSSNIRWLPSLKPNVAATDWITGVFNTILAPASVIEVGVVVEHAAVPAHSLRVALPILEIDVDAAAMRRATAVVIAMATLPEDDAKVNEEEKDEPKIFDLRLKDTNAIRIAWNEKQNAQWKLNNLKRLLSTLQLIEDKNSVFGLEGASLPSWISTTKKHIEDAVVSCKESKDTLAQLVSATKRMLQVQPHLHLVAVIGGVHVKLISPSRRPILSIQLDKISAIFATFLDQSGSLEFDLYKLEAHFYSETEVHPVLVALDDQTVRRIGNTLRKGGLGKMYLWDHDQSMVRVQAKLGTPHNRSDNAVVDIRHFEVVLVPLVVNLTRGFVVSLFDFFVPPNVEAEKRHDDQSRDAFLHAPKPSTSLTSNLADASRYFDSSSPLSAGSQQSNGSGNGGVGQSSQVHGRALLFGGNDVKESSEIEKSDKKNSKKDVGNLLLTRAHVRYLRLGQLVAFVSYKGENWAKLEDFDSLQVKIHPYVIRDQTCSFGELAIGIRNHVVMDILSQVGRNFVNIGAFLATKFNGFGLCAQPEWSTGAILPQIEKEGDDTSDEESQNADEFEKAPNKEGKEAEGGIRTNLTMETVEQVSKDTGVIIKTSPVYDNTEVSHKDLLLGPSKQKKAPLLSFKKMSIFGKKS